MIAPPWAARFWEKVEKGEGCWEWRGAVKSRQHPYGTLFIDGKRGRGKAHRLAWELAHGPIPDGMHVLHQCDNPRCVRVDHLHLGTHRDNMRDKVAKGRANMLAGADWQAAHAIDVARRQGIHLVGAERQARGERVAMSVLREDQVREIRKAWEGAAKKYGVQRQLAKQYGVDRLTIFKVIHRQTWAHIEPGAAT